MKPQIKWQGYYETAWQFWTSIIALVVGLIVLSYLMYKGFRRFWCKCGTAKSKNVKPNSRPRRNSRVSDSNARSKTLSKVVKMLASAYLVSIWFDILWALATRAMIIFFGIPLYCWIPDYAFNLYVIARLSLVLMYLSRYVYVCISNIINNMPCITVLFNKNIFVLFSRTLIIINYSVLFFR